MNASKWEEMDATLHGDCLPSHPTHAIFREACELLAPALSDDPLKSSDTVFYRALRKLHQAYPELSQTELEALVATVVSKLARGKTSSPS